MSDRDYRFTELMQLAACSGCSLCADVCPAVCAAGDGKLSGLYRIDRLRDLTRARSGWWRRFFGKRPPSQEELRAFADTVFSCTLCGRCQQVCPSGIQLRDLWFSLRQDMAHSDAAPAKTGAILENVTGSHNVFDEDNEERAEWVEDMRTPPEHGYIREKADVVYFTGCVAAFFPMAQQIPMALVEIFDAAGVDFTLLGEDEWCCGFPLMGAGMRDRLDDLMSHNMDAVKARGAHTVVFACPSCYQMWREHYPDAGGGLRIAHVTRFLRDLIRQKPFAFKNLDMTVTYHDPCDLGRGSREYEAPREVIRALPGVRLIELPRSREHCLCCGGGGNLEMLRPELSAQIAAEKVADIQSTGASAVITACQQCVRTMNTYVRRNKIKLEVLDIVQLVRRALDSP